MTAAFAPKRRLLDAIEMRLNSDWAGYSPDFGNHPSYHTTAAAPGRDGLPCSGHVGVGPYTAVILSQ